MDPGSLIGLPNIEKAHRPQRVVVCGLCPLPFENSKRSDGPGIRTWQFARSLQRAGFAVDLIAMIIPGSYDEQSGNQPAQREVFEGVSITRVDSALLLDKEQLAPLLQEARPDLLVGATIYGSFAIAQTQPDVPFWADQFGHVMAEAQAKAALEGENWPIPYFWNMARLVGRTADRFSAVSTPQMFAMIGELGALGRLVHETCGEDLISVIPCAVIPQTAELPDGCAYRGRRTPDDAFVVLWSGGYNVWSDVRVLFEGLEAAMTTNPRIWFVSTGGAIVGHDSKTYQEFEGLTKNSSYSDRFLLDGWVDASRVPRYALEADIGVLTEKRMYEGMLGSKNRILQWMGQGLPVLYNRVGELGDLLKTEGLGVTFETGSSKQLAENILWAAENPLELTSMAEKAGSAIQNRFSFEATTTPLVAWALAPAVAKDRGLAPLTAFPTANPAEIEMAPDPSTEGQERTESTVQRGWASNLLRRLRSTT